MKHQTPPHRHLSTPHSRSRRRVAGRNRVVDVDHDTRVSRLVRAGECDLGSGISVATVLNLDLGTAEVELRTTGRAGRVECNVLTPQ